MRRRSPVLSSLSLELTRRPPLLSSEVPHALLPPGSPATPVETPDRPSGRHCPVRGAADGRRIASVVPHPHGSRGGAHRGLFRHLGGLDRRRERRWLR